MASFSMAMLNEHCVIQKEFDNCLDPSQPWMAFNLIRIFIHAEPGSSHKAILCFLIQNFYAKDGDDYICSKMNSPKYANSMFAWKTMCYSDVYANLDVQNCLS